MDQTNGTQRLRRYVASLSLVTLITSLFVVNVAQGATFSDVQPSDWFYTYVEQLASGGILDAKQKTYRPGDNANRAEAAKMLVQAAGLTLDASAGPSFKDVAKDAWHYKYVETAVKNGVLGGYMDASGKKTGKFGPGDNVTREQFAKMAYNALALKKNTDGGPHFSDVAADRWSYEFVESLYNWSVVDGYADKTFKADRNINRAEISKMVVGAMNPVKRAAAFSLSSAASKSSTSAELTFSDDVDTTDGAKAANYSVKESGGTATLAVSAAVVKDKMVTLTTAAQMEGKKYTVTVSGVKSKAGKALDSAKSSADFTVAVSTFNVKSATAKSAVLAEVMFSMDVDATEAVKAANYAVKDAAGTALAVSAAVLATGKTDTVWLTTATQTVDKEYTLTVSGVKSKTDAKALAAGSDTAKFKGYNPVMATAKSATSVEVTFADDVDTVTGAVAANYVLSPALAVSAAAVKDKMVTLTTASQTGNAAYTLTVKGVKSKVVAPAVAKDLDGSAAFTGFSTTPVVTGGALTVASASETPAAKTIATATANNTLLVLDFTAGGDAQVSGVQVWKTGLYNDSSVKIVAFDASKKRISSGVTFSDGVASMSFYTPLKVSGATPTKVWLNVSVSGTASGTLGLRVKDATAVTSNSSKVSGSFPIDSIINTVVDGTPSVAAANVDVVAISTTARNVDIGQKDFEVTKFKITESSSKEDLKINAITLFNNGSVADGDVKDFKLVDTLGNVLATVADQKSKLISFDLSKSPYVLTKGSNRNFSVRATFANGATRTAQLILQNDFDLDATGVTTGASILPTAAPAGGQDTSFPIGDVTTIYNAVTINSGTLTVSKSNSSPSGDLIPGAEMVLGTFDLRASGEDLELQRLKIDLSSSNAIGVATNSSGTENRTGFFECNTSTACDLSGSVKIQIDDGGTSPRTIYTVSAAPAAPPVELWSSAGLADQTISSYYTIPSGKTVKLLVVGTITSDVTTNTGTGEQFAVGIRDIYYYRKTTLDYQTAANLPATFAGTVTANTLTVNQSSLTVSKDTSYPDQTAVAKTGMKLGSFVIRAVSDSANISSINIKGATTCGGATAATGYSNMKLMDITDPTKPTQLGTTVSSVPFTGGATGTAISFTPTSFSVKAGDQKVVEVDADAVSTASNVCLNLDTNAVNGTGSSGITVQGPVSLTSLQLNTLVTSGTLTVSLDTTNTPVAQILHSAQIDTTLLASRIVSSNAEDITITNVQVSTNNGLNSLQNLKLFVNGVQVGSTASIVNGVALFTSTSGIFTVPKDTTITMYVKGSTTSTSAINSQAVLDLSLDYIEARGASGGTKVKPGTTTATAWTLTSITTAGVSITVADTTGFHAGDVVYAHDVTAGGSLGLVTVEPTSTTAMTVATTAAVAFNTAGASTRIHKLASGATTAASAGTALRAGAALTVTSTKGFSAGDAVIVNDGTAPFLGYVSAIGSATSMTVRTTTNMAAAATRVSKIGTDTLSTGITTAVALLATANTAAVVTSTTGFNAGDFVLVQDTTNAGGLGMVVSVDSATGITLAMNTAVTATTASTLVRIGSMNPSTTLISTAASAGARNIAATSATVTSNLGFGVDDVVITNGLASAGTGAILGKVTALTGTTGVTIASAATGGGGTDAATRVTRLPGAASAGRAFTLHDVEPTIATNTTIAAGGASTGQSDQLVAGFDIKADGDRPLNITSLNVQANGSNIPWNFVTTYKLFSGSTQLSQSAPLNIAAINNSSVLALTGTTIRLCSSTATALTTAGDIQVASADVTTANQKIAVNDTIVLFTSATSYITATVTAKSAITSVLCAGTGGVAGNSLTLTVTNNSTVGTATTPNTITAVKSFNVIFDGNASTPLATQVITQGSTLTLTVKADTTAVRSGLGAGTTASYNVKLNGTQGSTGGLTWSYTPSGATAAITATTVSDSYPVNGPTFTY